MRYPTITHWRRICACILCAVLLMGNIMLPVHAESDPLKPADTVHENGNIVLHKQATRIAADEWEIDVQATINDTPVEPPKLEVTFVLDASNSMDLCAEQDLHQDQYGNYNHHFHHYFYGCNLICGMDGQEGHTHTNPCYDCGMFQQDHYPNKTCTYVNDDGIKTDFTSRFEIAKQVITKMISALPEGTRIGKVYFNNPGMADYFIDFDDIDRYADTYMMEGVRLALKTDGNTPCFSTDPTTKKILIIVSDGVATDGDYGAADEVFQSFRNNGGIVYTVGFNYSNPNLNGMTANGGTYSEASNPDDLEQIFDKITVELTAMLVDPMGSSVGFEVNSAQQPSGSVNGSIDYDSNNSTLYWRPSSSSDIKNSTFGYSYKVKLNNQADRSVGTHTGVDLNKPTNLLYGLSNDTTMKSAAFPIPKATYAISSLQVKWMCGETELKAPTDVESVICDWPGAAFTTDYSTITPSFTQDGKEYYYSGTVITKDGTQTDTVSITDAAAFIVTHQYSEEPKYKVDYEYIGEVPENAPDADIYDRLGLDAGMEVTVEAAPSLNGYQFSGWTVAEGDVTITDGIFTMPQSNVKLVGSWAKLNGYRILINYFTSTNGGAYVQDNDKPIEFAENLQTPDASVTKDISDALTWNGNTYESPKLAENSASAEISGNSVTLNPSDPVTEVIINLYRDVKTKARVVVQFVDVAGQTLRNDFSSTDIYVGDPYNVSSVKNIISITVDGVIYDFISDDNAKYEGTMDVDGEVIKRVYQERRKASVVVHFVGPDGNTLREDISSGEIYVGGNFDVSSAEIESITVDGVIYDFDTDGGNATYSGEMPNGGAVITRVYKERSKAQVIVHFVDADGNTLREDISSDNIYVGNNFDLSSAEIESITVNGVIYDFDDDTDNAIYSGEMPNGGAVITRVYKERSKAQVIVHFVDADGNTLREDISSDNIYVGNNFDVSSAEIETITVDGVIYDFDTDGGNSIYSGQMQENGAVITRVYKERSKAQVIVHFVDADGNTLREDISSGEIYVGNNFDVSSAEIESITVDGVIYDFDTDGGNAIYSGQMQSGGDIINRVYKEREKAKIMVQFVDTNGNKLRDDITTDSLYIGSNFDVTEAVDVVTITFNGSVYDFLTDSNAVYIGIVDNDGEVITRVYQERGKATVIVQFVDENGNKLREDITSGSVILGQSFNVSTAEDIISITIDGKIYDFDSDGNNTKYSGTMQENGAVINRVYKERERASVIVQFVDDKGNKLRGDITSDKTYIGSDFDVSSAKSVTTITIDGVTYEFVSDNNASYSGKMVSNGEIITRIYKQKTVSIPESTIPESSVPESSTTPETTTPETTTPETTTPETTTPETTTPETTTPETTTSESNKPSSTIPNTGDFGLGLWISTLLLSACAILIISKLRRHAN